MKKMDTSIVSSCCIIALSNTFWSQVNPAFVGSPILTQSAYVTENTAQYLNDIFSTFVINPQQDKSLSIYAYRYLPAAFQFRQLKLPVNNSTIGSPGMINRLRRILWPASV